MFFLKISQSPVLFIALVMTVFVIIPLIGFVILINTYSIWREWRGRFLTPINAFRIIDYFGGEIEVNENSKLAILKSAQRSRPGIPEKVEFVFTCKDEILEEFTYDLVKTNRERVNINFSKPWRKDIGVALNNSLLRMNKEIAKRENAIREYKRKFYKNAKN